MYTRIYNMLIGCQNLMLELTTFHLITSEGMTAQTQQKGYLVDYLRRTF